MDVQMEILGNLVMGNGKVNKVNHHKKQLQLPITTYTVHL